MVIGSRSDRRVRWFDTKVELFVLATAVPEVDSASMADFTGWAMDYVKSLRSGLPGARDAAMILPALASGSVQPSARDWAAKDALILGTSLIGTSGVARLPLPSVYQPSNDPADLDGGDGSVVGTKFRADRVQYRRPRRPAGLQHGRDRVRPTREGSVEGRSHVS